MIKLKIKGESPDPPPPTRTVEFEFRRHKQAASTKSVEDIAWLIGREPSHAPFSTDLYPIKIDGVRGLVEVRRESFERLGFEVIVK